MFYQRLFIAFTILFSLSGFAQNKYEKLDKIARAHIPKQHSSSPGKIASYLVSFAKNDEEKARILFVYTTHVLKYDIRRSGTEATASWSIKNGVGVCAHYARLYTDLCRAAGLKCVYVSGYSRSNPMFIPFRRAKKNDHAWNAVRIDKKWYLVDATWADGGARVIRDASGRRVLQSDFNEKYWLIDPEEMILNHYPDLPRWQLLESVVTLKQYRGGRPAIQNMNKRIPNYNYNDTIQRNFWLPPGEGELADAKDFYNYNGGGREAGMKIAYAYMKKADKCIKKSSPSRQDYEQALSYMKACKRYTHGSPIKVLRHGRTRRFVARYKRSCRLNMMIS